MKKDLIFFIISVIIVLFLSYKTRVDFKALTSDIKTDISKTRNNLFWIKGIIFIGLPLFFVNSNNMSVLKITFFSIVIILGLWNFMYGFLYLIYKYKNKNM